MDIDQVKRIPILDVALKLGATDPVQKRPNKIVMKSFRGEQTASLWLHTDKNFFKDFGSPRKGGNVLDMVIDAQDCRREERGLAPRGRKDKQAISDALAFLRFFDNMPLMPIVPPAPKMKEQSEHYKVLGLSERITDKNCRKEYARRCYNLNVSEYIKQAKVKNTESGKTFHTLAMENIKGGIELHMHYPDQINPDYRDFKNIVGPKALTIYPAHHEEKNVTIYAFSSKHDFGTEITLHGRKKNITYVIYHGDGLIQECADYIISDKDRINKVLHFDHTDKGGIKADNDLALLLEGFDFGNMSAARYPGFKDYSEWRMKNPYAATQGPKQYQEPNPNLQNRNHSKYSL